MVERLRTALRINHRSALVPGATRRWLWGFPETESRAESHTCNLCIGAEPAASDLEELPPWTRF